MPAVSIILPTYNRAKFLPAAFEAIAGQTWTDWELIVVDDGSTDNTRDVVRKLSAGWPQSVRYIHQENQGAYGARNTGLNQAAGKYFALYDSDDLWLPPNLGRLVEALDQHAEVDIAFGPARVIDMDSGRVIRASSFYPEGRPRRFLQLQTRDVGDSHIIEDAHLIECAMEHGVHCGPQCMLARREVFAHMGFPPFRVGEDQVLVMLAVKRGFTFAYFNDPPTVDYLVHDANTSLASSGLSGDARIAAITALIDGLNWFERQVHLSQAEQRALNRRISETTFWQLGYPLAHTGRIADALPHLRRGLQLNPKSLRFWKTYLKYRVLSLFSA